MGDDATNVTGAKLFTSFCRARLPKAMALPEIKERLLTT
jgi:hypothetical protein